MSSVVTTGGMNDPDQTDPEYIATTFITTFPVTTDIWMDNTTGKRFIGINNQAVLVNGYTYD